METTNAWKKYTSEDLEKLQSFTEGYRKFISDNKTERECAASAIKLAEAAGYVKLSDAIAAGKTLKAGDKVYADIRGKSVIFVQIGTKSLEEGLNILGAHIDSPAWTSSRTLLRSATSWPPLTPTTTAASRSTSGSPFPWQFTAFLHLKTVAS